MTVDEFLVWSTHQESGRYELQDGRVIMQQSQNIGHLRTKGAVYDDLREAIRRSKIPLYARPDGATVRISNDTAFEPDALMAHLPLPDSKALEVPNPVVVAEVLSPYGNKRDRAENLKGYSEVASTVAYLIVDPCRADHCAVP